MSDTIVVRNSKYPKERVRAVTKGCPPDAKGFKTNPLLGEMLKQLTDGIREQRGRRPAAHLHKGER